MEHRSYRGTLFVTIGAIVALLAAIGLFIIAVDPYQQYRPHTDYLGNQRMEIAGVARHHDYDAFISGSSMAMNHYPAQADSLWGWKTKNFSLMGATDDDYAVILPFVISRGKVRNIVLGIDFFSFARQRGAVNPYLYDDNLWNDYEYLWNYTSLKNAIEYLRNPRPEEGLYHFNSPYGRGELFDSYARTKDVGYPEEIFDLDAMKERFDASVLKAVSESPDSVRWHIYFPPYSIAEFIIYDKYGDLDANLALKRHMIERLSALPNVDLYDFQTSPWIDNLDQYMDLRHHSHAYNRDILRSIREGRYRALPDGGEPLLRSLVAQYRDSFPQ